MSAMSEPIKCPIPAGESIFVMRRINIVLNHVYKYEVIHRVLLPKVCIFSRFSLYLSHYYSFYYYLGMITFHLIIC